MLLLLLRWCLLDGGSLYKLLHRKEVNRALLGDELRHLGHWL